METREIIKLIFEELKRAEGKHPSWPKDKIRQAAIIGEEAGELLQAAIDYEYRVIEGVETYVSQIKIEAIQTAAMAIRLLKHL